MKKLAIILSLLFLNSLAPAFAEQVKLTLVDFGDYRSTTLANRAWDALEKNDTKLALAYTNKCIALYSATALKMQSTLKDYATGANEEIFKYWALNDVATCLYIQGESYRKAGMKDESKAAFNRVLTDFSFGQAWDPKGWFWKPASAAKDKLAMIESGIDLDFGDYTSSYLVKQAWAALAANDLKTVAAYVNKTVELYADKAREMQGSLKEYTTESKEKIASYWALNDVGTALFILGEAYRNAGRNQEAAQDYKKVIKEYFYAQCWDLQGWFWKPSEAAQQRMTDLDNV